MGKDYSKKSMKSQNFKKKNKEEEKVVSVSSARKLFILTNTVGRKITTLHNALIAKSLKI